MSTWRKINETWFLLLAAAIPAPAQTFTVLASFDLADGAFPWSMSPVQGLNGHLFGTTYSGGIRNANCSTAYPGCGVIFEITPAGALTVVHRFDGADGANPTAGLLLATGGNLYAVTSSGYGGPDNCGTIYKVSPGTTLHVFQGPDGCGPNQLIEAAGGSLYGTTTGGGTNLQNMAGTIFKVTPGGDLTVLHSFTGPDGADPSAALLEATNGSFYGTTTQGGGNSYGTIFKITSDGTFTSLYSFCTPNNPSSCATGLFPYGALVQDTAGNLYGTTSEGGAYGCCGTVFKMTPAGDVTALHSFCSQNCTDGYYVFDGLLQATDGNFYGTTDEVAASIDCGTIFRITPGGAFTVLHTFDGTDGCSPHGGLTQGTDGVLYGAAFGGGAHGSGTVYSLSVGLAPFVKTLPHSGQPGSAIKILGTNLTGTTSVSFHGTAAAFTVVAPTEIETTVPPGATTGKIQVTTPSGTLFSGGPFLVRD
jgi:uncharacterized repeat protein (TIGR03803 family)